MTNDKNNEELDKWMKDFYEAKPKIVGKGDYEHYRWFSSERRKMQYEFSLKSLLFHLKNIKAEKILEIGCGPGTWTKIILKRYPKAYIECVELSSSMIEQFKKNIKDERIKINVKSFLDFDTNKRYDFVFSSRAIEYIPNKEKIIEKIWKFMEKRGKGVIITSPPHHFLLSIKRAFGKKIDKEHTDRISIDKIKILLRNKGFYNIEFYPILFTDNLPKKIRRFLWNKLYNKKFGLLSKIFASGYLVKFEKPDKNGKK